MRIFNDFNKEGIHYNISDKDQCIKTLIEALYKKYENNEIKDIFIIARTTDEKIWPEGLPHNMFSGTSVDTEYETTVFMRFATDILFNRMKDITIKDIKNRIKEYIEEERKTNESNNP